MLSPFIIALSLASSMHSPEAIKDYIYHRATEYNVSPTLAIEIVRAESNFDINAKNKGSTASGLAQYINGTFKSFCIDNYGLTDSMNEKNNPYVQIECLVMMLADGGVHHWSASKSIWKPKLQT
jgi:hypothetical protein